MIKAGIKDEDGNPIAILGLSDKNLERLRRNKPILVDLKQLGMTGKVVIMWGATEADITKELSEHFRLPS